MNSVDSFVRSRIAKPWNEAAATNLTLWALAFCVAITIVCTRRPDVLLNPQFYAEDGAIFYRQAHDFGFWRSLLTPHGGYFHLLPRIVAGFAQLLPFSAVPLLFNWVTLSIQVAPALFLLSGRSRNIGPFHVRVLLALFDLGIPQMGELNGDLAGAHFHLAVLTFLVIIAAPSRSNPGRFFDLLVLICGSLTGPFCIVLLPVALFVFLRRREPRTRMLMIILASSSLIQMYVLVGLSARPQSTMGLGASLPLFFHIMTVQVFLPLFAGAFSLYNMVHSAGALFIANVLITIVGISLAAYALLKGCLEIQALILFAALMLSASLAFPLASMTTKQWEVLVIRGSCSRYWYVPYLAITATSLWFLGKYWTQPVLKPVFTALLICIFITVVFDWRYPAFPDMRFGHYAEIFDRLPAGVRLWVPINPPGWFVKLTKTPPDSIPGHTRIARSDAPQLSSGASPISKIVAPLSGSIDSVNGAGLPRSNSAQSALPIPIEQGLTVSGWVASSTKSNAEAMGDVFLVASGEVIGCGHVERPDVVAGLKDPLLQESGFVGNVPSVALHPGLQLVTIIGYEKGTLYRLPRILYIK